MSRYAVSGERLISLSATASLKARACSLQTASGCTPCPLRKLTKRPSAHFRVMSRELRMSAQSRSHSGVRSVFGRPLCWAIPQRRRAARASLSALLQDFADRPRAAGATRDRRGCSHFASAGTSPGLRPKALATRRRSDWRSRRLLGDRSVASSRCCMRSENIGVPGGMKAVSRLRVSILLIGKRFF